MKFTEIKDKTAEELAALLKEKKLHLFMLNAKLKTMQLKNTHEIRETKKDIARVMTAINAQKGAN